MDAAPRRADFVLWGPYGLRAGWRILLWIALTYTAAAVLGLLAAVARLPRDHATSAAILLTAAVVAGWVMLAAVDRRRTGALGFAWDPAAPKEIAAGTAIGGALLGAAVLLLALAGMARWVADTGSMSEYVAVLARSLAFFAVAAAMEEAVFRGYPFQALVQGIGVWPAVLSTSALFAAAHGGNPEVNAVALANIFLAGVLLGAAYLRTRSLWFATAVHLGWNWAMSALLDFPVSGLVRDTPLYSAVETGPDLVTGGPFGPEAGLAATLVLAAGTAWLWRTRRIAPSARMRDLRPLVDARMGEGAP